MSDIWAGLQNVVVFVCLFGLPACFYFWYQEREMTSIKYQAFQKKNNRVGY